MIVRDLLALTKRSVSILGLRSHYDRVAVKFERTFVEVNRD